MNTYQMTTTWLKGNARVSAMWLLTSVITGTAFFAISDVTPTLPNIPAINLAPEPLYAKGTRDKPTISLALSVEFPTVGAQYVYRDPQDPDHLLPYDQAPEYLGYFDANSCYTYNNAPAAVSGYSTADLKRFDRTGAATSHGCAGAGFSGNFMNWATSSAIDVLRLGLTGGDRIVDTGDLTVLQRAVLRNGGFYNDPNFPAKQLTAALANDAVPSALRGNHTGDIWVANCLNRVHFGTQSTGSCASPGNNSNLGVATSSTPSTSCPTWVNNGNGACTSGTSYFEGTLPSGFSSSACANENQTCANGTTRKIAYGAGTHWAIRTESGDVSCSNGVFADPIYGAGKSCYKADSDLVWTPPTTTPDTTPTSTVLSTDNFFYTRVKVCESSSGALVDTRKYNNEDYCLKYPSGNYKPAGNLQKFSDRLRVSAFGYLMDDSLARYGGVLRAPMKYVGPKRYDTSGILISGSNPNIEWNETTGVFEANPESASEGKSGVINYLNQFGRTGTTQGRYKTHDPVGELYYEAVRYIQGLDPTPQATSSITADMKDGFPVYDKGDSGLTKLWTDPHAGGSSTKDYSCQKNNIVVIGDVNTHADKSVPGNTLTSSNDFTRSANLANNEPDFRAWTHVVGGFEAGNPTSVSYTDGKGNNRNTSNEATNGNSHYPNLQDAAPPQCCNNNSYLMAGVAYWANTHDVRGTNWTNNITAQRPGMRITTYVLDVNEYGNQTNLDTRVNNQFYLAAKYGGFKDQSPDGRGNPFLNSANVADDTSWAKDGTTPKLASKYFLSSSAADVLKSLRDIFDKVAQEGNSIAGGAVSTQQLAPQVGGYIYQAQFDAANWSGDLVSLAINLGTNNVVSIADTQSAQWRAGAKLNAKVATTRKIYIGKATPDSSSTATEFKTLADLEGTLQGDLKKATPSATADSRAQDRIDFIRGNRSLEGSTFRTRSSVLGDIINSGVAYSGAPTTRISSVDYLDFFNDNKTRTKVLFVGANDGLLHAFNAADGEEVFAYIPSWLGPKLPALTNATYNTGNHQSFMDGSPAVSEAFVGSAWETVLVSGTGGGGQGVFALNVTNPDAFDASKVMWEFTDRDDPDMGNVIGRPQILKFRTSAPTGTQTYKWFAVVPSGVNNYAPDGDVTDPPNKYVSLTGRPALFLLDLSKPKGTAWELGTNYYKISLRYSGDTLSTSSMPTGLANVKVTGGPNDEVALIYAGDLQGNLWKLDFTKLGFDDWKTTSSNAATDTALDKLSAFKTSTTAIPFFIAKDESENVQPITMEPAVVRGPGRGIIVMFGTGKYLESTDNVVNSSTQVQSVYALLDNGTDAGNDAVSIIPSRGRLIEGSIVSGVITVPTFTWGRPTTNDDDTQRSGWYFDYTQSGERQISGFGIFGNRAVFGSVIPPDAVVDACGSGTGYQYTVNIATGNGTEEVSQVGLLGQPFVLEVGSGNLTISDSIGRRVKTTTAQIILQGSSGLKTVSEQPTDTSIVGRLSWRQINNYQDLKHAP